MTKLMSLHQLLSGSRANNTQGYGPEGAIAEPLRGHDIGAFWLLIQLNCLPDL
jgi:hypothetical protein